MPLPRLIPAFAFFCANLVLPAFCGDDKPLDSKSATPSETLSLILAGDFASALQSAKESREFDEEAMATIREAGRNGEYALNSLASEAQKQIMIMTTKGSKNIKPLYIKDSKLYYEDFSISPPITTALRAESLADSEKLKRLNSMPPAARALASGVFAYRRGAFSKAEDFFKDCGSLSDPLLAAVSKRTKPVAEMMVAISEGDEKAAEKILKEGLDMSLPITFRAETEDGGAAQDFRTTLLHEALMAKQNEIATLLMKNGAELNVQNANGMTPLMVAIMKNPDSIEIVSLILERGADPNLKDRSGDSALTGAISLKRFTAADLLIRKGADVNAANKKGFTPLMLAVFSGSVPLVKQLIESGADTNARHREGWTLSDIDHSTRSPEMRKVLEPYLKKKSGAPKAPVFDFGGGATNRTKNSK